MAVTKNPPYLSFPPASNAAESIAVEFTPEGFHPYLHILKKRKWVVLSFLIFFLFVALWVNATQTPIYRASIEVVIEPKNSRQVSMGETNLVLRDPTMIMTQIRLIQGPKLVQHVIDLLDQPREREFIRKVLGFKKQTDVSGEEAAFIEKERKVIYNVVRSAVSARQIAKEVRIIEILAESDNPEMAKKIADTAAEAYRQINHKSSVDSFKKNFEMISESLAEVREKMKLSEIAFKKIDSEIKLLEALDIYGEKFPRVMELQKDIPVLTKELEEGMLNLRKMKIGQRSDLRPLLLEPHMTHGSLIAIKADLYNLRPILEQEGETNREMYNTIFKKLQEVEIAGGGSVWFDAEVIEPAPVPKKPIRPNKKMNIIIALILGVIGGVGVAFFVEYMNHSIRSLEDVQLYLKLFPLGMIPFVEDELEIARQRKSRFGSEGSAGEYWLMTDPNIPLYIGEAYRIVRTNLAFGSIDSTLKVLQVTSAVKGEGKTTTTANLGISLAQAGMRVLLVDADMRRPALHHILHLEGMRYGLNDLISNHEATLDSIMEPTTIPNLYCLASGVVAPNPSELLSSKRIGHILDEVRENFDMVLIDSPPIMSVADAAILASRVDGTILVILAGYIPRHFILQAKKSIESVNGKVVGCVLNGALSEHHPYYYRQYGKDSYYYLGDMKSDSRQKGRRHRDVTMLERLQTLKEPVLTFAKQAWNRFKGSKPGPASPTTERKAPDGHR